MEKPMTTPKGEQVMDIKHIPNQKIGVQILPPRTKLTRFERVKMHLWNFVLPPHIRLDDWTKK